MRAAIWKNYGPPQVLEIEEIDKPIPSPDEVLIQVHATSVFQGDCEMRALKFPWYLKYPLRLFFGWKKPKPGSILGQELSGVIEEVGENITDFKVGDEVYAAMSFSMGAYAEYKAMKPSGDGTVAIKPLNISHAEAATIPVGGLNALYFIRKASLEKGSTILINGAGGSIGVIAIQLAKYFGAEITIVDSEEKLPILMELGADHTIDFTRQDFTRLGTKYDVVLDIVGGNAKGNSLTKGLKAVKKGGKYVMVNPKLSQVFLGKFLGLFGKKVISGTVGYRKVDLDRLTNFIEKGEVKPVIDMQYTLEQIAEAHEYVDTGRKTGNVAITVRD
ncbi:MAG: NAD(P)-dependent alcohol dehydrogenase [Candidatus Heimdallarchaeota archaeon]|nr:NAD(P)-dependent alcohol dehydrogenase [Candidatus Heimdallarchaeota archaeon]